MRISIVYSFDSLGVGEFHHSFKEKGLFLCVPVLATTLRKKCKGKQYNISSPVLGVFGTSSKQGKFTLQLQIRKLMLEEGYSIAQMSSEPTGMLFGMEECVPFGFNSFNSMGSNEFISEINERMHRLDILQSELIIVGSQSGTVPEAYNHLGQLPIRQIEFLLGCMPDGIVLCVNPNDDIGYIARTIGLIENLSKAKVIALGIYPFFYENGWKFAIDSMRKISDAQVMNLKELYFKSFLLKSFVIGDDSDARLLVNCITDFFLRLCRL